MLPDPNKVPLWRPDDLVRANVCGGRSAVYAGIKSGEIPSVTINGRIWIPVGELRRRWAVDAA